MCTRGRSFLPREGPLNSLTGRPRAHTLFTESLFHIAPLSASRPLTSFHIVGHYLLGFDSLIYGGGEIGGGNLLCGGGNLLYGGDAFSSSSRGGNGGL